MRTTIVLKHTDRAKSAHATATRQSWAMPLRHHTHHTHTASSLAQSDNSWLRKNTASRATSVSRRLMGFELGFDKNKRLVSQ